MAGLKLDQVIEGDCVENMRALPDGCADLIRQSNKKVSNAKLKSEFGLTLRFPTFREGLRESARRGWKE